MKQPLDPHVQVPAIARGGVLRHVPRGGRGLGASDDGRPRERASDAQHRREPAGRDHRAFRAPAGAAGRAPSDARCARACASHGRAGAPASAATYCSQASRAPGDVARFEGESGERARLGGCHDEELPRARRRERGARIAVTLAPRAVRAPRSASPRRSSASASAQDRHRRAPRPGLREGPRAEPPPRRRARRRPRAMATSPASTAAAARSARRERGRARQESPVSLDRLARVTRARQHARPREERGRIVEARAVARLAVPERRQRRVELPQGGERAPLEHARRRVARQDRLRPRGRLRARPAPSPPSRRASTRRSRRDRNSAGARATWRAPRRCRSAPHLGGAFGGPAVRPARHRRLRQREDECRGEHHRGDRSAGPARAVLARSSCARYVRPHRRRGRRLRGEHSLDEALVSRASDLYCWNNVHYAEIPRMTLGPSIRHHGGSGEPLLLLHPFALNADAWRPVLPALERRHEVLAATFPGHMGGERIPRGFQHSIAASVDMAEAELDAAGIGRVHIAGNSLGGWFALELARRGRALSTVAFSPGGGWERGSAEEKHLLRTFKQMGRLCGSAGPLAPVLGRIGWRGGSGSTRLSSRPGPADAGASQRSSCGRPTAATAFYDVLRACPTSPTRGCGRAGRPDSDRLGQRRCLLPLQGYSERWRRLLPSAEWLVLDGAGHVPMYDDPRASRELILEVTTASRAQGAGRQAAPTTLSAAAGSPRGRGRLTGGLEPRLRRLTPRTGPSARSSRRAGNPTLTSTTGQPGLALDALDVARAPPRAAPSIVRAGARSSLPAGHRLVDRHGVRGVVDREVRASSRRASRTPRTP